MAARTSLRVVDEQAFQALRDEWLHTLSSGTRLAYGSDLRSFSAWKGLGSRTLAASTKDVSAFQRACLDRGESPSTVRRRSSALMSFFGFAVERQSLQMNPVAGSDRPGV